MARLNFVKTRKIWFTLSSLFVVGSIASIVFFGLNFGIDFTGGSLLDVTFSQPVSAGELQTTIASQGYEEVRIQTGETQSYFIRLQALDEGQHQALLAVLRQAHGDLQENRFDFVGPVMGKELAQKAIWAVLLCLVLVMLYVTWAFRKASQHVASWKYGAVTILAAFHNMLIPIGVFAILGHFYGFQVDSAFIAAVLTILGYSINDTIVALDRIRENLHLQQNMSSVPFTDIVNTSLYQTLARSINTTVTVLLSLLAVFFFGGETLQPFVLALIIGVVVSAYSSIFITAPLLVVLEKPKS